MGLRSVPLSPPSSSTREAETAAESIYAFVRNRPATFFVYSRRRTLPLPTAQRFTEADSPSFLPSSIS